MVGGGDMVGGVMVAGVLVVGAWLVAFGWFTFVEVTSKYVCCPIVRTSKYLCI